MQSILVLLSTYNGDKFLREQLNSLYSQNDVKIHILVRDDGSKDNTVMILNEYKSHYGNMTILAQTNIGCARSFYYLINYAVTEMEKYDYYAFCDQDDVWLPEKLHKAIEKLNDYEGNNKLYFCCSNYVDSELKLIRKTNPPKYFDYKTSVFRNPALGCTMVFDRKLLELSNYKYKERILSESHLLLHDAWFFMCANFLNSYIYSDEYAFINYRQHGGNVTSAEKSIFQRYIGAYKRAVKNRSRHYNDSVLFLNNYFEYLGANEKNFLVKIKEYRNNFLSVFRYLTEQPWRGESLVDKMLWRFMVIFRLF